MGKGTKPNAFLASFLIFFALGRAESQPKGEMTDQQIQQFVEQKLEDADILTAGLTVTVNAKTVYLKGTVPHVWAKQKALELALDAPEVQAVEDDLAIATAESDKALAEQISKRVLQYAFYEIFDSVKLSVEDGVVTLDGRVTMPYKADRIGEMTARILGVQRIVNQIKTLPVSENDERLRWAIANRIYGDSMFYEYSFWANPPIHIIVEGGRVTLMGVVRSEVERVRALSIARSTFGAFSVESELQVGSQ